MPAPSVPTNTARWPSVMEAGPRMRSPPASAVEGVVVVVGSSWIEEPPGAGDGCAGCGASIIIRTLLDTLGPNTIVVDPPNCSGVNYAGVVKVPWVLANFASAPAYETGIYRALRKKGKADKVYVTMERNMKCAVGFCGHCQYGPTFICKDGPVFDTRDLRI